METCCHPLQTTPTRLTMGLGSSWLCLHFGARGGEPRFSFSLFGTVQADFWFKTSWKLWAILQWFHPVKLNYCYKQSQHTVEGWLPQRHQRQQLGEVGLQGKPWQRCYGLDGWVGGRGRELDCPSCKMSGPHRRCGNMYETHSHM